MLTAVLVKGRASLTKYSREQFGPAWKDVDTRDDILAAQLTHVSSDGGCRVLSGSEADPYTNASLYYVCSRSTVDIDHVVALGDAWQTGTQQLSLITRTAFANDPALTGQRGVGGRPDEVGQPVPSRPPKRRSQRVRSRPVQGLPRSAPGTCCRSARRDRGRDLACWCPSACHADVLLAIESGQA